MFHNKYLKFNWKLTIYCKQPQPAGGGGGGGWVLSSSTCGQDSIIQFNYFLELQFLWFFLIQNPWKPNHTNTDKTILYKKWIQLLFFIFFYFYCVIKKRFYFCINLFHFLNYQFLLQIFCLLDTTCNLLNTFKFI